jgi:hypothetical protein
MRTRSFAMLRMTWERSEGKADEDEILRYAQDDTRAKRGEGTGAKRREGTGGQQHGRKIEPCHPERSEGSRCPSSQALCCAEA